METIRITEIPSYVFESITKEVDRYSTGLIRVQRNKANEEANLIGSGTLIKIEEVYGILTAQHVTDEILRGATGLGLIVSPQEHRYVLETKYLHIIEVAKASEPSKGPDLSVIILPNTSLGTLMARKSFYSLSRKRTDVLQNPLDYDVGIWLLCGYPDEQTTTEESNRGYDVVKGFHGLCGGTGIEKAYVRGDYDFLEVSVRYRENEMLPESFGGVSGGGLWQAQLLRSKEGDIQTGEPILSGVAFYETEIKNNVRYIKCHGRRSIYKIAYEVVKQEYA